MTELARQLGSNYKSARGIDLGKQQTADIRNEIKNILRQLGAAGSYLDIKSVIATHRSLQEEYKEWLWRNDIARTKAEKVMSEWRKNRTDAQQFNAGIVFGDVKASSAPKQIFPLSTPTNKGLKITVPYQNSSRSSFLVGPTNPNDGHTLSSCPSPHGPQVLQSHSSPSIKRSPKIAFVADEYTNPSRGATGKSPRTHSTPIIGGASPIIAVTPPMKIISPFTSASTPPTASPLAQALPSTIYYTNRNEGQLDRALESQTIPYMTIPANLDDREDINKSANMLADSAETAFQINSQPGNTKPNEANKKNQSAAPLVSDSDSEDPSSKQKPQSTIGKQPAKATSSRARAVPSLTKAPIHSAHSYDTSPHLSPHSRGLSNPLLKGTAADHSSGPAIAAANTARSPAMRAPTTTPPISYSTIIEPAPPRTPAKGVAATARLRPYTAGIIPSQQAANKVDEGKQKDHPFLFSTEIVLDDANGRFRGAGCDMAGLLPSYSPRGKEQISSRNPPQPSSTNKSNTQEGGNNIGISSQSKSANGANLEATSVPQAISAPPLQQHAQAGPMKFLEPKHTLTGSANNFGFQLPKHLSSHRK